MKNNIVYCNGGSDFEKKVQIQDDGTGTIKSNNLITDPKFVDAANNNFKLQSGSPAIAAGTDLGLSQDIDGSPVLQGIAPDIGACQSTSVNATTQGRLPPPQNVKVF